MRRSRLLFIVLLGALATGLLIPLVRPTAGAAPPPPRIAGGEPVEIKDHPYMVAIPDLRDNSICGGVAVTRRYVVTSATCALRYLAAGKTEGAPTSTMLVSAGLTDLQTTSSGVDLIVDWIWVHPRYSIEQEGTASVALLTLETELPDSVQPLALPNSGDPGPYVPGTQATILGYGDASSSAKLNPAEYRLLAGTVPVRSDEDCRSNFPTHFNASAMVCAGGQENAQGRRAGVCQPEDQGAPLITHDARTGTDVLAGVFIAGREECGTEFPGVFTRMSTYADDVREAIRSIDSRMPVATKELNCVGEDSHRDPDERFRGWIEITYQPSMTGESKRVLKVRYKIDREREGSMGRSNGARVVFNDDGADATVGDFSDDELEDIEDGQRKTRLQDRQYHDLGGKLGGPYLRERGAIRAKFIFNDNFDDPECRFTFPDNIS